jgi:nucleotide-binding universal stress UspA family protein
VEDFRVTTNRILVPLDGSALAERALPCATALARALPAELVLFQAVSLPSYLKAVLTRGESTADVLLAQLVVEAQDYLTRLSGQLQETGVIAHATVRQGPAAEGIVDYAEQTHIQQIVMATHGHGGISRWVHGSVTERVLQSASMPVLLVRVAEKREKPMMCRRILVPLDGSSRAEQVFPTVTSIAQALDARTILFRVLIASATGPLLEELYLQTQGLLETAEQEADSYLKRVAGRLQEQGVQVSTAIREGAVADTIVKYAETNHIDLIAMCTHGRTGLARWSLGSVADRVLRAGRIPILLVRAR